MLKIYYKNYETLVKFLEIYPCLCASSTDIERSFKVSSHFCNDRAKIHLDNKVLEAAIRVRCNHNILKNDKPEVYTDDE